MADRPLTPRQQAFVAAYVGAAKGNATEAARIAGYNGNDNVLGVTGHELLKHPKVAHALSVFRMATHTTAIMTAEEAAERLSRIARGDPELTEKRVVNGGPAGFVDVETPPAFSHQIEAIKALAKMRGYDAPVKSEVAVSALAPETEAALIAHLRAKREVK